MNENISWGKIGVLVVAIVGIGTLGFVMGRKNDEVAIVAPVIPTMQPAKKEEAKLVEKISSAIEVPADWKTYTNEELSLSFKYPQNWHIGERWVGWVDIFIAANEQINVLEIQVENEIKNVPLEHAKEKIRENRCPEQEEGDTNGDHIIRSTDHDVLYVLHCSAMSESYIYEFLNKRNQLIKMTYHDDFGDLPDLLADENHPDLAGETKKLEKFEKIIQSLQFFSDENVTTLKVSLLADIQKLMGKYDQGLSEKVSADLRVYESRYPEDKEIHTAVDGLLDKYGPCWGIPEGQCRE